MGTQVSYIRGKQVYFAQKLDAGDLKIKILFHILNTQLKLSC